MDEALRVGLVVHVVVTEGGEVLPVEAEGALASHGDDVALVEFQAHHAGDGTLGVVDERVQGFPQGAEPQALVDEFPVLQGHQVLELQGGVVQHQGFQFPVGDHEDGAAGGLVKAPGLHPHQTVLHHVHPADAVLAPQGIEVLDELRGLHALAVDRHGRAAFELDIHVLGFVGRVHGGDGAQPDELIGFVPGVL